MLTPPDWADRRFDTTDEPIWQEYFNIVENVDPAELYLTPVIGTFLESIVYPVYGRGGTEAYNRDHARSIESYGDLRLPATVPGGDQPRLRVEWAEFVRDVLNPTFIVTRGVDPQQYRDHLRDTYTEVDELNKAWGTAFDGWQEVELPDGRRWLAGPERQDRTRDLASSARLGVPPVQRSLRGRGIVNHTVPSAAAVMFRCRPPPAMRSSVTLCPTWMPGTSNRTWSRGVTSR